MKKIFILSNLILTIFCCNAQLQIGSGINWKSNPGIYVVLDNMSLQHDALSASLDNTFKFSGNSNVSISGTTLPLFTNVEVVLAGTSKIILQRTISISQRLSFQSGLLDLNNNNIDLGSSGTVSGESETTRIIGPAGGYIQIVNTLNAPDNINPGNLGILFTSSQNFGSTIIRRGHKTQTINTQPSINRYYDINPANNSSLNAALKFTYFDAELNGGNESELWLWKSDDLINWFVSAGTDARDAQANYVNGKGFNSFSRLTLSSAGFPVGNFVSGQNKNELKFWPNPYSDEFNLGFLSTKNGEVTMRLYNMSGKLVVSQSLAIRSGRNLFNFSFPKLPAGTYVMKIDDKENLMTVGKIIKLNK